MNAPAFDAATLSKLSPRDLRLLIWRRKWLLTARESQLPPDDDQWTEWIYCAGRGAGKTKSGANWFAYEAITGDPKAPCFVIAPTLNDVRYTCFEGPTGILSELPEEVVKDYNKTNLIITLDNGAIIRGFSAEEPERLRGPQARIGWLEEVGAWTTQTGKATFDMFKMGLRLGDRPRFICTTTPRPNDLMRQLLTPKENRKIVKGSTYDNRANLPDSFFDELRQYEGTRLGRQELDGELIDDEEGAIIARKWLKLWPAGKPLPTFDFLLTSFDTAFTDSAFDSKSHVADPTACGTFGAFWNPDTEREEILLLDCWDEHLSFPDLLPRAKREMEASYGADATAKPMLKPMFGPKTVTTGFGKGRKPDILLIEDKGSGISLRQMLEREGIPLYAYNPGNADKAARLHMISHIFQQGMVWVPESTKNPGKIVSWADPPTKQDGRTGWATQVTTFKGKNSIRFDDYCDVTSQAIRLLVEKGIVTGLKKTKEERKRDDEPPPPRQRGNPYSQ